MVLLLLYYYIITMHSWFDWMVHIKNAFKHKCYSCTQSLKRRYIVLLFFYKIRIKLNTRCKYDDIGSRRVLLQVSIQPHAVILNNAVL